MLFLYTMSTALCKQTVIQLQCYKITHYIHEWKSSSRVNIIFTYFVCVFFNKFINTSEGIFCSYYKMISSIKLEFQILILINMGFQIVKVVNLKSTLMFIFFKHQKLQNSPVLTFNLAKKVSEGFFL